MIAWLFILAVAGNAIMAVWAFERKEYSRMFLHFAFISIVLAAYGR